MGLTACGLWLVQLTTLRHPHPVPTEQSHASDLFHALLLTLHSSPICLGEGNGTPLQYSCLENPMGGGAIQLCGPMNTSVRGILQARLLEWVAIPFFRGFS